MTITSQQFSGNRRLERAANNNPPILRGEPNRIAVSILQSVLVKLGFKMPSSTKRNGSMDGIYGNETTETVRKFQRENGLVNALGHADGIVGRNTMAVLDQLLQVSGKQAIWYDVPLIPQPTDDSCWAAAMAMVVSFYQNNTILPQQIAASVSLNLHSSYGWSYLHQAAREWGLRSLNITPNIVDFPQLLKEHGPLWLVVTGDPSHAVVLTGTDGIRFSWNDPSPPNVGRQNIQMPITRLARRFGTVIDKIGTSNFQVLYYAGTDG